MSTYKFDLPEYLIARTPVSVRSASKLLSVSGNEISDCCFNELPDLLAKGDLLVLNDSRVFPARLLLKSPNGGNVELLLVRSESEQWYALAKPARRLRQGVVLSNSDGKPVAEVMGRENEYVLVRGMNSDLLDYAEESGLMPLPPYIRKARENDGMVDTNSEDSSRYQTVYANQSGSVAAPTAGLHFDDKLFSRLEKAGVSVAKVSLHVGPGTFKQPSDEDLKARRLHREMFSMSPDVWNKIAETRTSGGKVIAVGTTTLRVLETVHRLELGLKEPGTYSYPLEHEIRPEFAGNVSAVNGGWAVEGETRLFVTPPDRITVADGLITNFHLPESSLLRLVASFLGDRGWEDIYEHAVKSDYRFYSYGDAMLIIPGKEI
ncbi:tRNA preQ1(34) S-adenosylmethionine ribosyltransferase-isomerase QueA [bacterium]|nr:tRNA preQ1(34) S-adenosylmethionine ribosyltransferase-isomerase QueA [bacterium]